MLTYRTESRIVSSNDSGVLCDVLGRLVLGRLGLGRLVFGRLIFGRLRLGRLIFRRLVSVLLVLGRFILGSLRLFVIILTTGSNCGGKRRSGRHDLNETHLCGINEGQKTQSLEKLLS